MSNRAQSEPNEIAPLANVEDVERIPKTLPDLVTILNNRYLEQLRGFQTPLESDLPEIPFPIPSKKDLINWIHDHKDIIDQAIDKQGNGGDTLDWDVALLTLIESCATYLRKDELIIKAIHEAQKRNEVSDRAALALIEEAQSDINDVAKEMGLQFTVLCDFVKGGGDAHPKWAGAFGGVFYSLKKEIAKPLIGLAFKGTFSIKEAITDAQYTPISPSGETLYAKKGVKVHEGFYYGMFDNYKESIVPFELLAAGVVTTANFFEKQPVPLHFTGHSLGGAYACLSYAEILRRSQVGNAPPFFQRDMITLGGPRVALDPLATIIKQSLSTAPNQHTWRLVANKDYVPTVPPGPKGFTYYPYVHYDTGYQIFKNKDAVKLDSELGKQVERPTLPWPNKLVDHAPVEYYNSILHSGGFKTGMNSSLDAEVSAKADVSSQ